MEKLSEISLGQKGWLIKFGSVFIVVFIGVILYLGIYKISMPLYANVEIVAYEADVFLVSPINLKSLEKIKLENGRTIPVNLKKIDAQKYRVSFNNLPDTMIQNLRANVLTDGKILMDKENLFESLLPFW